MPAAELYILLVLQKWSCFFYLLSMFICVKCHTFKNAPLDHDHCFLNVWWSYIIIKIDLFSIKLYVSINMTFCIMLKTYQEKCKIDVFIMFKLLSFLIVCFQCMILYTNMKISFKISKWVWKVAIFNFNIY